MKKRRNGWGPRLALQQEINKLTADIIKLRAELNYWEKQKVLAMQAKIMGGVSHDKRAC